MAWTQSGLSELHSTSGQAITIGIVNSQAEPQTIGVKIKGVKLAKSANVWRIAGNDPEAINTADKQAVAIAEEHNVSFGDRVTVPAYSVSLYRVPLN